MLLMNKISELEIGGQDVIMDTSEYPNNNRKVVIFDELINVPDKIQNKIANHFTDGRHHKIITCLFISVLL